MRGMRRRARFLGFVVGLLLAPAPGHTDGGVVRLHESRGNLTVSVFTAPDPLRVGLADLSVLIQSSNDGAVLLDPEVTFTLSPPAGRGGELRLAPSRSNATNQLLQSVEVSLPVAGIWELAVSVRRGGEEVVLTCLLPVTPLPPSWVRLWPLLALVPLAIALFAANQAVRSLRAGPQTQRE